MGHIHHHKEEVYRALAERLNQNPIGAPVTPTLMEILYRLYTESEAHLASKMPFKPVPAEHLAPLVDREAAEVEKMLQHMAERGLVIDIPQPEGRHYLLAPMVVGFFEYTFMRTSEDFLEGRTTFKELAQLFETYFQDPRVQAEMLGGDTKMFYTLAYERLLPAIVSTEVMDYEKAAEVIRRSGGGAISLCACRHKASHLGHECSAPKEVCTSLGRAAQWLVYHGFARPASVDELLRVLEETEKAGLVHLCDNVLSHPAYICHCCGCCCTVLKNMRRTRKMGVHPSNYLPRVERNTCAGCGTCADACQIDAITMTTAEDGSTLPVIDQGFCIGCGVCAASCPTGALSLTRRSATHIPPATRRELFTRLAHERGKI